jgi:hypothetical protein
MNEPLITRKEIASIYGISVRQIVRHEKGWRLDTARSKLGTNPLLYRRKIVAEIMRSLGAGD